MKLFYFNFEKPKIMLAVLLLLSSFQFYGQTMPTPQSLPFTQNFSSLLHSSSVFPAGFQGWQLGTSAPPGATWRTSAPIADVGLGVNASASNVGANAIQNYNGKIGFLHSGSSEPSLAIAINTSGLSDIQVNYNVMTIRNPYDGSTNTRIIENIIQYRIGTTGTFTNITSVAYQNNTTNQVTAGVTTPQKLESRSVVLPAECNNQPNLQIRWVSRDVAGGVGSRPSIAVDDIDIRSITPVISTSGTLSALSTIYGSASNASTFSFSAANLTADVTISAPTGFEISTTETSGFSTSLSIPISSGAISATTIYVRLAATTVAGNYSGNIALTSGSTSVNVATVLSTVNQRELTISGISIADKNYDGNNSATIVGTATLVGIQNSDAIILGGTPVATFNDATVGNNKPVTVSGYTFNGTNSTSYYLTQPSGFTANIISTGLSDQTITFNALSSVTYGDASFSLNATSDSGLSVSYTSSNTGVATINGNTVTIVGVGTTTITASQDGDASYNPAISVNQNLEVNQKQLTIVGAVAEDKVYDGNTDALILGGSLDGVVGLDDVAFSGVGSFDSPYVGTDKTVTGNLVLTGLDAANYNLTQPSLFADISAKEITVTGISIANKEFDNTTSATIVGTAALSGVELVDVSNVQLDGTPIALFDDASVGNTKNVTVSGYTISGTASTNYILLQPQDLTADISLRSLTITGLTAEGKVYDRTNSVVINGTPALSGLISGDENNVNLDGVASGSFDSYNVGPNNTVSVTGFSISGVSASNYSLSPLSLQAFITAKELTIQNASVNNKTYDGTVTATLNGDLQGVISPDEVVLDLSGTFDTATVGQAKPVTSTSTLSGLNAGNYVLTQPTGLTANILADLCSANSGVVNWDFSSGAITGAAPSQTVSNVSISNLSGGQTNGTNNFVANSSGSTGYVGASGTFNASVAAFIGTLNTGTSTYYEFTVTPTVGYVYTFSSISFGSRSTGSGPKLYSLRSSLDGYSTDLASGVMPNNSTWSLYSANLTLAANQTGAITFRLYGSNGTGTPAAGVSNWRIDDIILNITASPGNALSSSLSATACSDSNFSYTPTTNYAGATITWTRAAVAGISNEAITTPQSSNPNENLVNTTTSPIDVIYTFTVTNSTCYVTQDVVVTVDPVSVAGTAGAGANSICSGTSTTLTLTGSTGTIQWETSANGSTGWSPIASATSASLSTGNLTSTTYYRAVVTSGVCASATSNVVTITVLSNTTYYTDADGDGYGNPASSIVSCLPLAGYVANATDCNDASNTINPGAIDVCYDGIDNDCNGNIDNIGMPGGCTPIYTVPAVTVPNSTISYGASIITSLVANAQGYRYVVTRVNPADDTPMSAPVTVDMGMRNLFLSNLSNYAYGAKYKVESTVRINNVWQPNYAPAFFVFTPTPLSTLASCGTQISNMTTQVTSSPVALVSVYRYQVQRLDASNNVVSTQVITSGLRYFSFEQVTDYRYDANYSVSCAIRNLDGVFMTYGPACTIQAPKHPTSEVRATQCNDYVVSSYNENIYANLVRNAVAYRYRLYNVAQGYDYSVDKNANYFRLTDFPGLVPGETYSVQVAVSMPGQPDFGAFSKTCTIIVPSVARTIEDTQVAGAISFEATVYPNPFAEHFYFKVNSASNEDYTIQVYDMLGKLVDTKTVAADSVESTEVGANFPAGVYNVIVTQGGNFKTLRVVKR